MTRLNSVFTHKKKTQQQILKYSGTEISSEKIEKSFVDEPMNDDIRFDLHVLIECEIISDYWNEIIDCAHLKELRGSISLID